MTCQYCFFNHWFEFQDSICIGCHDLPMLCLNITDITIITVTNVDNCCIICNISKSEAINLLERTVLENCGYILKNIVLIFGIFKTDFFYFFV